MGIASYLRGTAYRRGVLGSSRAWLGLWIVMAGWAWLRRNAGRAEEPVLRVELEPGERLLITHETLPVKTRRRDRKAGG
jgi:hypothetical protein